MNKRSLLLVGVSALGLALAACAGTPGLSGQVQGPPTNGGQAAYRTLTVSFDPSSGTGFVGKGDVQEAFGWNNAQLQANAGGVAFSYDATDTYSAVATWITGEGTRGEQVHNVSHTVETAVNSAIVYDARKNSVGQITGFNLTGLGTPSETGTVPVVGDPAPGHPGTDAIWSSVTLTGSSGGLFAHYGAQSVQVFP